MRFKKSLPEMNERPEVFTSPPDPKKHRLLEVPALNYAGEAPVQRQD